MKKLPSISPTDLARIATLPVAQQLIELQKLKKGFPPFTYRHTRLKLPDILNLALGGMFSDTKAEWKHIEDALRRDCTSGDEFSYNVMAAKALYEFANDAAVSGTLQRDGFGAMPLGQGHTVAFWEKAVVNFNGRPHIIFIDLRSSKFLSPAARRFAFSAQHEQIRERDDDFREVGLLILRVTKPVENSRKVISYTDEGVELFSFDQLLEMTKRTYSLWEQVYFERTEEERKRAAGDDGPLFR